MEKHNIIIGYSGHAYVVCDVFESMGLSVSAYFDQEEKKNNPYGLKYYGHEDSEKAFELLEANNWFVAIGNNQLRKKIITELGKKGINKPISIFHPKSVLSSLAHFGYGTMIAAGSIINSAAEIGNGVICNTGAIIEHECKIEDYVHIAPGAVLAGNVIVGESSFVGANTVVKEGVRIGKDVIIGAGSVILKDVPDNVTIVGNPGKIKVKK